MSNPFEEINSRLSSIEGLLKEIKEGFPEANNRPNPEEFYTVPEAAAFLKLSIPTIYTMTHEKRIPFIKVVKRCYFLKSDLIRYLKEHRIGDRTEILQERGNNT